MKKMTERELDLLVHGPAGLVDRRRVEGLRRRWQKLCEDAIELAREAGAKDPNIYIEAEAGFYVVDGDTHPDGGNADHSTVVFNIDWPTGIKADCGAW